MTNAQVLILKLMIGGGGGQQCTAKHGHDTRLYIPQKIKELGKSVIVLFFVFCVTTEDLFLCLTKHHTMKTC